MKKTNPALSFIAIIATVAIVFSACRKINESTELGGDLIPAVDNINTFDTLINVLGYNDTFGLSNDSQYLARSEEHFLGLINNDPFFGKTDARIFFELKPSFYPQYPFNRRDSIKIDSIVVVLNYIETYGDTNIAQSLKVYEIDNSNNFRYDSSYLVRKENVTYNTSFPLSLPGQLFFPRNLNDSVKVFRDTTRNQLRIRLDTNFARRLFNYDTTNAYKSDSAFRSFFRGFAIRSEGSGNAIMGFDFGGVNTKLAVYYNHPKVNGGGVRDTTVNYFYFTQLSAAANYVKRDYNGYPSLASLNNGTAPDPILFIQNSPGTYANIKLAGLNTISNRVVHRAELIVEQLYDISDSLFNPPEILYLDAFDNTITSNKKFRAIPYDLRFSNFGEPDFLNPPQFGVIPIISTDASGNKIRIWKFNISRYVQHVFTNTMPAYDLRLYAPFTVSNKFLIPAPTNDPSSIFNLNPTIAKGRIRLIGNTGPADNNPRRMRLRIVYSKL